MDDNYTKFPNIILDLSNIDIYESKILWIIVRKTIGYGKKSDGISLNQFVKLSKISKNKVIRTIRSLENKKLIIQKRQNKKNGAYAYSKYSLAPMMPEEQGASSPEEQGASSPEEQGASSPEEQGLVHRVNIHKDNNTRERNNNTTFSKNDMDSFIDFLLLTNPDIRNQGAYKIKMRKNFEKQDKQTLEEFKKWENSDGSYKHKIFYQEYNTKK